MNVVARHGALALVLIASFLVAGCGAVAPTSVPATATRVTQEPTRSPLPTSVAAAPATVTAVPPTATAVTPTATVVPPAPTDTPLPSSTATRQPPTAVPPETPTPAPLLLLENSPQLFGRTETFQVGLGDLDGDGDLDAVLANMAANHSQVWFNGGGVQGGTPGEFTDSGQKLTQQGHGLGLGDLDGDGDLDILLTCAHYNPGGGWSKMPSRVYLNDGQGKFAESEQGLGDTELSGNGVNLIDLDGDGDLDAHVIYYEAADKVYVNDGLGRFSDSGLALEEEEIAWGDLDADGDVDMLAKAYGEGYRVLLNDGTGRFVAGWQVEDSQAIYGDLALADLDGDGDLDALDANGFRSEGSFPTRLLWNDGGVQGGTPGQFTDSGQELPKTMAARFALGDLDRDGDLDLYVSNMPPRSGEAWLNDGAGQLVDSGLRLESPSRHLATWPSLGDLDGDGDLDLVEAGFQGKAEVWLNRTALPESSQANTWEKDGSVMVYVPAGAFWMGSTSAEIADAVAACVAAGGSGPLCRRSFGAEVPRHEITLDAFWIDRTEVTNTQYRKCVEAGVCEEPATCYWGTPTYNDSSKADHPVVCVAWSDASTYCQWAGKRLPTEAEWEKAARGTDGLVFPWGDAFDGRLVNFCDVNCESERRNEDWDDGYADTAPVGSYADGESPYGAWDMAGNVWEWVSDWYDGTYYAGSPSSNPPGPDTGTDKVARGGSWYGLWSYTRTATRRGHQPSDRGSIFGIRCAVEATNIAPPAAADTPLPPTTGSTQPPAPGDTWTRPADSMTMVYVLGGEFQMGSAADDPQAVSDELPAHTVTLDSFWIDQTEVTNAQFVQFLNEQGNSNVQGVPKIVLDEGYAQISQEENRFVAREVSLDRPVVMVTWHGAAAYCQWAGGRLPTEAEWEYAARGPAGNPYPWGDAPPTCDLANHGTCVGVPQQTGSRPAGASWCGALDLAGSVWEWVADWYAPYTDRPQYNPTGPPSGDVPVLRGGGWHSPPWELRATYRQHDLWANGYNGCVGFRCVVTHQPERASVGLGSAQPACFTAARSSQPALDMRQGASVSFALSARRL